MALMGGDVATMCGAAAVAGAGALCAAWRCMSLRRPELPVDHWLREEGNVVGHRGCRIEEHPTGNTVGAFRRACKAAAQEGQRVGYPRRVVALELDVQLTACGEVVVFHDLDTAGILVGDNRVVMDMTHEELLAREFRAPADKGEKVPLLRDIIQLAKAHDVKLVVELKGWSKTYALSKRVIHILDAEDFLAHTMIISFNPLYIYWVRTLCADLPTAHIAPHNILRAKIEAHTTLKNVPFAGTLAQAVNTVWRWAALRPSVLPALLGATSISTYYPFLTSSCVARAHSAGLTTNAWTVNCEVEARRLRDLRLNAITTDIPETLLTTSL